MHTVNENGRGNLSNALAGQDNQIFRISPFLTPDYVLQEIRLTRPQFDPSHP